MMLLERRQIHGREDSQLADQVVQRDVRHLAKLEVPLLVLVVDQMPEGDHRLVQFQFKDIHCIACACSLTARSVL